MCKILAAYDVKNDVIEINDVIGLRQKRIFDKYVTCDNVIYPKIEFFIWMKTCKIKQIWLRFIEN